LRPPRTLRRLGVAAALLVLASALGTGIASAQAAPPAAPTPAVAPGAAPGRYGAPEWLPLRHDIDGHAIKVGCTYASHGSAFGYECGGHHDRWALDLIAPQGTPVYASGAGFATNATGSRGASGYGNSVRIDHAFGVESLYAHLSLVLIPAEGMWVDENTVVGLVGSTGSSSANHLHYEKRVGTDPVDPGPLKACQLGTVVTFPQVAGVASWKGIPWGAFTVASDGTGCELERLAATMEQAQTERAASFRSIWQALFGALT
jgi:hypothetical protein